MEIPTLSEEEKWEMTARQYADMLRAEGKDNATGFAMGEAIVRKNLMGSDVEVDGNAGEATLNLKRT